MRFVIAVLLDVGIRVSHAADIKAGEKVFKKCKACHVVDKERTRLARIWLALLAVRRPVSKLQEIFRGVEGKRLCLGYRNAMAIEKKYLKGGKMYFAGLKKQKDRDNIIAYFESLPIGKSQ